MTDEEMACKAICDSIPCKTMCTKCKCYIAGFKAGICMNEVEKYRKGILNIAGKLNAENKKCKEIIKRTVVEHFSCDDCKEVGLFDECLKREKSCETIVSEWFDKVMEQ